MGSNAKVFVDLIESLKQLGGNTIFELLLYIQLEAAGKSIDRLTIGELIEAAKAANVNLVRKQSGLRMLDADQADQEVKSQRDDQGL
jgi:hypothetical protein